MDLSRHLTGFAAGVTIVTERLKRTIEIFWETK